MPFGVALSVSVGDVRDGVIVVWGAVSIILVLIRLAILAGTGWFGWKGMRWVHGQMDERVRPGLEKALAVSQTVRDRTARFPGAPGSTGGPAEIVNAVRDMRELKPPFRRKTKSWRPF